MGFQKMFVAFTYQFQSVRNVSILITILLLAACSKDAADEESYLKFTYKGTEFRYTGSFQSWETTGKGIYAQKSSTGSPSVAPYYLFQGFDGSQSGIMVTLRADSLATGTYSSFGDARHLATGIQLKPSPSEGFMFSALLYNPKAMLVHISKHSGGRVSGTFSCRVYRTLTPSPMDSTEISGEFSNLEVRY